MRDTIQEVIAEILDIEESQVTDELGPNTDGVWDSLNHLKIVTALQQELGVELSLEEIQEIRSVAILRDVFEQRRIGRDLKKS